MFSRAKLVLEVPEGPVTIVGQKRLIDEAIDNLLRDAIEFVPEPDGEIVLENRSPRGAKAVIRVPRG